MKAPLIGAFIFCLKKNQRNFQNGFAFQKEYSIIVTLLGLLYIIIAGNFTIAIVYFTAKHTVFLL
jgi:hypothetical protein